MSSEVPLDLSNESKPDKSSNIPKLTINSNVINGTKSTRSTAKAKPEKPTVKVSANVSRETVVKKQKTANVSTSGTDVNPLLRGKYGLRMLPQQVDYYQSVLEDRRIRMYRESSRPTSEFDRLEKDTKTDKTKRLNRKPKTNHSSGKYEFEIGDIVWGTLPNYKTWFPALIISHMHCKQKPAKKGQTWVYWFGDHQVSEIPKSKIKSFVHNFPEFSKGTSALTSLRVKEALQVLASRAGVTFPLDESVASSSKSNINADENALISWAKNGFQLNTGATHENAFRADPLNPIPSSAACYLPLDSVYQEALKTDERLQQIVYYEVDKTENSESFHEIPEYKLTQIERVKNKEVSIYQICIACCCDAEALVGSDSKTLLEHPIFEGGLCRLCYDNIRVTMYAPGADNKNSFCAICGQLGNLAICDNENCHRVYCLKCIDLLVGSGIHLKVLEMERWECYICKPNTEEMGLLKVRHNWRFNVKMLFDPLISRLKASNLIEDSVNDKRQIRVLSLMDGIGTAKIALEKIGLKIDTYWASEIDTDAVEIAKTHHKNTILFVDSLENITIEKIVAMSPIDLVLGSSPIEYSSTSSSRKTLIGCQNCKPITLYANDFCQNRNRYYWSNIPGIKRPLPQNIQEKFISLINILTQNMSRKSSSDKTPTSAGKRSLENESEDKSYEPIELEKLFGLQENYTDVNALSKSKRQSLLTRSWCVSILSHLIWSLTDFFVTEVSK